MELNLIDKLTLLALDDEKGTLVADSTTFPYALASTIILELALRNRIEINGKKVKVLNSSPTGDVDIDFYFEKISSSRKERSIKHWVQEFGNKATKIKKASIEKMVKERILFEEEGKILWVFKYNKYPTQDPAPEVDLRNKLSQIIVGKAEPNLEEVMLLSLVATCELVKEVFGKDNAKAIKEKIIDLAQNSPSAKSMHKAIKAIHEELMAVMMIVVTTVVITS
ncbi:GPP34 family phosphoprotein [Flammeovirgaceae bacterium SG7u.111]|nr:GPP34 family phosphoprotein [Flammeovirgaceae bacterium SG7u.132]WPO34654.1 GPP34 family phosphoprotein [Flammeovirgaceae bacterium SG7u.111]